MLLKYTTNNLERGIALRLITTVWELYCMSYWLACRHITLEIRMSSLAISWITTFSSLPTWSCPRIWSECCSAFLKRILIYASKQWAKYFPIPGLEMSTWRKLWLENSTLPSRPTCLRITLTTVILQVKSRLKSSSLRKKRTEGEFKHRKFVSLTFYSWTHSWQGYKSKARNKSWISIKSLRSQPDNIQGYRSRHCGETDLWKVLTIVNYLHKPINTVQELWQNLLIALTISSKCLSPKTLNSPPNPHTWPILRLRK